MDRNNQSEGVGIAHRLHSAATNNTISIKNNVHCKDPFRLAAHHQQKFQYTTTNITNNDTSKNNNSKIINNSRMELQWRNCTSKLLDFSQIPIGQMDSLQRQMLELALIYWSDQKYYDKKQEGLQNSLKLLDRYVQESIYHTKTDDNDNESSFQIPNYLLNAIVKNWNYILRHDPSSSPSILLPSMLLAKFDEYYIQNPNVLEINAITYSILLDGASRCSIESERVVFTENLLERLLRECQTNKSVTPTVVTFATVAKAWSFGGKVQLVEKAQNLLRRFYKLHEDGVIDSKPNDVMYVSVMNGWAQAGNPIRAEELLKEMYHEHVINGNEFAKPSLNNFNTVLSAWSKSSLPNAAKKAEALVELMNELSNHQHHRDEKNIDNNQLLLQVKPDIVSYNCLLNTYAKMVEIDCNDDNNKNDSKCDDDDNNSNGEQYVAKAEALLKKLAQNGIKGVIPNEISYSAYIKAIDKSQLQHKAERVKQILQVMQSQGLKPSQSLLRQAGRVQDP